MPVFNQKSSSLKFVMAAILVFTATACHIPDPQKKNSEGGTSSAATFYFDSFNGETVQEKLAGTYALPESKTYSFVACLKDKSYSKPIISQKFRIAETHQELTSDGKGCVNWTEIIGFNFLGQSQYVLMERNIVAVGAHQGSIILKIAMNPWSHGESLEKAIEISKIDLKNVSTDLDVLKKPIERKLWIDKAGLFTKEEIVDSPGVKFVYEFQAVPQLLLSKMNGEKVPYELKDGAFKIKFKLIESMSDNGKEVFRQLSESETLDGVMRQNQLSLKFAMKVLQKGERGQLYLGVELSPSDDNKSMTSFQGLYLLGDARNLKPNAPFMKLQSQSSQNLNFNLQKDLDLQPLDSQNTATAFRDAGIVIEKLHFKSTNVGAESTTQKQLFYKIEACLTSGIDSQPLRSEKVKLTSPGLTSDNQLKTTDQNGCFEWTEALTYGIFPCQDPIPRQIQMQSEALKLDQTINYFLNPRDSSRFGWDARWENLNDPIYKNCTTQSEKKSILYLTDYRIATLSMDYSLDSFLNLTIQRNIKFELNASTLMPSHILNGRQQNESLRSGNYLLRLAVVKSREYTKKLELVSVLEKIVSVIDGHANIYFPLELNDIKDSASILDLLVELHPLKDELLQKNKSGEYVLANSQLKMNDALDSSSGLISPTYTAQLNLRDRNYSQGLAPLDKTVISSLLLNDFKETTSSSSVIEGLRLAKIKQDQEHIQFLKAQADPEQYALHENSIYFNLKKDTTELTQARQYMGIVPAQIIESQKIFKNPMNYADEAKKNAPLDHSLIRNEIFYENISPFFAQRLCTYWMGSVLKDVLTDGKNDQYLAECLRKVSKDPSQFFNVQSLYRIGDIGRTELASGVIRSLSINSNYSARSSFTDNFGTNRNFSVSPGFKFFDFLGVSSGYQIQWATQTSKGRDQTSAVSESIPLEVQKTQLKFTINSHEKCLMVRLNPHLYMEESSQFWFEKVLTTQIHKSFRPTVTAERKINLLTKGLLLCSGDKIQKSEERTESFYLISQNNYMSETQDAGNLKNNSFFLQIRGDQDYERFLNTVKLQVQIPATTAPADAQFNFITTKLAPIFKASSSSPGFYLQSPESSLKTQ